MASAVLLSGKHGFCQTSGGGMAEASMAEASIYMSSETRLGADGILSSCHARIAAHGPYLPYSEDAREAQICEEISTCSSVR